jgi:hypothetical protein
MGQTRPPNSPKQLVVPSTLVFGLLKDTQLKDKLRALGLPTIGKRAVGPCCRKLRCIDPLPVRPCMCGHKDNVVLDVVFLRNRGLVTSQNMCVCSCVCVCVCVCVCGCSSPLLFSPAFMEEQFGFWDVYVLAIVSRLLAVGALRKGKLMRAGQNRLPTGGRCIHHLLGLLSPQGELLVQYRCHLQ